MLRGRALDRMGHYRIRDDVGCHRYDGFCAANFRNVLPWTAAVEYVVGLGIDRGEYEILSPVSGPERSTLFFVTHRDRDRNGALHRLLVERGSMCS